MPKQITPEILMEILVRIPEGFIQKSQINIGHLRVQETKNSDEAVEIGQDDLYLYDRSRLNSKQFQLMKEWADPIMPAINSDGRFADTPILVRIKSRAREFRLQENTVYKSVFEQLTQTKSYYTPAEIAKHPDEAIIQNLVHAGGLDEIDGFVYDPLRVSVATMRHIIENKQEILPEAQSRPKVTDKDWSTSLQLSGDVIRPDLRDGQSMRARVLARTYILPTAAKRLGVAPETLEMAIHEGRIAAFIDPEGKQRVSANSVEMALQDERYLEEIAGYEILKVREIAMMCEINYPNARKRLARAGINRSTPRWSEIRGRWGLPSTLKEFRALADEKLEVRKVEMKARILEEEKVLQERRVKLNLQRENERKQRQQLRAKLVAAFPSWRHDGRSEQQIVIHVGPPNSGKTYHALQALSQAASGWYLAPLRLLAFEVFDRLNRAGVYCNLLTGEEHIEIPGATITAATIEMFDPHKSGEMVIVDEAHMLADPDRGWAWTRAIMEAESPEIRVICPPTAQQLIEQMASAAAIPYEVHTHERLAQLKVADKPFTLETLPARTILVAFSRQNVLQLKNELERMKRTVSVIYGNLPPEVRRKQADRFAFGQTDICVATDAVGMGLNLPADYVVFYELQKFDGKKVRTLTASEVQQIGGRAGRYGLSQIGEIGTLSKRDLRMARQLFNEPQEMLTHARVAPTVDDLELIPGNLAEKLGQWASLQSVPESLKSAIRTADLSERIELARMLTDEEVDRLGLGTAMKLINAPTRQSTRSYWYQCTRAILKNQPMPQPQEAPFEVSSARDLEAIESCVSCADIYLWLSFRPEFGNSAQDGDYVRQKRTQWSERIDNALLKRIDTSRQCVQCGKSLPTNHRFGVCDSCFHGRRSSRRGNNEFIDRR